ncbi:hypothetical protein CDAR_543461 [Caerostris darwini]|uniref:Uncharacterized protein n=1 Tax=Caerostris darwini TaxID=1538125 RepID=A0AAV4PD51_9ARAC|nr:hypothetical protein CDAR_543461 [Caerostris darwini]
MYGEIPAELPKAPQLRTVFIVEKPENPQNAAEECEFRMYHPRFFPPILRRTNVKTHAFPKVSTSPNKAITSAHFCGGHFQGRPSIELPNNWKIAQSIKRTEGSGISDYVSIWAAHSTTAFPSSSSEMLMKFSSSHLSIQEDVRIGCNAVLLRSAYFVLSRSWSAEIPSGSHIVGATQDNNPIAT